MTREEAFLKRMKNRSARLQRLLELKAPTAIVVNEACLIFEAALGLDEKTAGQWLVNRMAMHVTQGAGFCPVCREQSITVEQSHPALCPVCLAEIQAEDTDEEDLS